MSKKKRATDLDWSLREEEFTGTLHHRQSSPLLFGVVESQTVLDDLESVGILGKLQDRGYNNFYTDTTNHVEYQTRFRLLAEHHSDGKAHTLFDIRTHTSEIDWYGAKVPVLFWDWLEFQDPKGTFQPERPPLPGQEHPGLGVYKEGTELIRGYVELTKVDAIVAVPEYFHNAWLYSDSFCFYDPEYEGLFRALVRDLLDQGLAKISSAVKDGAVKDGSGKPFKWKANHQICPLTRVTRSHFQTSDYKETVSAFRESTRFEVDHPKE